jgi:methylated-DNA-protein-cysteine methyltransferase-like protein
MPLEMKEKNLNERLLLFDRIYALVRTIPPGEVATYGQIAFVAEAPTPRVVGFAMASLPERSNVPWHRVVNAEGRISRRKDGLESPEQHRRLLEEGVLFDRTGKIDLEGRGWAGPSWQWLEENGYDVGNLALRSQSLRRQGAWRRWRY